MPRDKLVAVVGLSRWRQLVFGNRELAFDVAPFSRSLLVVVVDDFATPDDDLGPKLSEDGPRRHHADGSTFIGVRNDLPLNQVSLGLIIDDNLKQMFMLLEEQVGVTEPNAPRRLCRQHVQSLTAAKQGKRSHAVLPPALEIPVLVDFFLACRIFGHHDFVVHDIQRCPILVNDYLGRGIRLPTTAAPSSTAGRWTPASSLGRRAHAGPLGANLINEIPVRWSILGRPTCAPLSRNG